MHRNLTNFQNIEFHNYNTDLQRNSEISINRNFLNQLSHTTHLLEKLYHTPQIRKNIWNNTYAFFVKSLTKIFYGNIWKMFSGTLDN